MMPFECDVRVSSKDHAVAASMSITVMNPATALHHYAGHNWTRACFCTSDLESQAHMPSTRALVIRSVRHHAAMFYMRPEGPWTS
jgi:hypothetical protein